MPDAKQDRGRTIALGAVQVQSQPGALESNCAHATSLIETAADQGAQLVVLPELFASGYIPNPAIWDAAEGRERGPMRQWLAATAQRLGIYLGAGGVERDGSDFFNVFVPCRPEGRDRRARLQDRRGSERF